MHRVLSVFFLVVCCALAWWVLELQGKLLFKEKELHALRKERDAATAPLHENIARLQKERDDARELGANSPAPPTAEPLGELFQQLNSPELKRTMRSQQLAELRKEFAALFEHWSLSPADEDAVLNFLADKELGAKPVLGDERMKELATFAQAQERAKTVGRYSEHLDISGFPLSTEQRTQLEKIIEAESSTAPEQLAIEAEEVKLLNSGALDDVTLARLNKREEDKQSRVIRKAKAFLTPDQISGLQSAFREENQEREAGMRAVNGMLKASGGAPQK